MASTRCHAVASRVATAKRIVCREPDERTIGCRNSSNEGRSDRVTGPTHPARLDTALCISRRSRDGFLFGTEGNHGSDTVGSRGDHDSDEDAGHLFLLSGLLRFPRLPRFRGRTSVWIRVLVWERASQGPTPHRLIDRRLMRSFARGDRVLRPHSARGVRGVRAGRMAPRCPRTHSGAGGRRLQGLPARCVHGGIVGGGDARRAGPRGGRRRQRERQQIGRMSPAHIFRASTRGAFVEDSGPAVPAFRSRRHPLSPLSV